MTGPDGGPAAGGVPVLPPGRPPGWAVPLQEVARLEWRRGDDGDPAALLGGFLDRHGVGGELTGDDRGDEGVALLLGAAGCALLAGLPPGPASPVPQVPDLVAVAVRRGGPVPPSSRGPARVGPWQRTWTDAQHAEAVRTVQEAIGRGEVYQANVVGHRSAPWSGDGVRLLEAVADASPGRYRGVLGGDGWAVASASPEQLVRAGSGRVTTVPIKGTDRDPARLRASAKDRAEHVMIVDLERNDLGRVAVTGSVEVEQLYDVAPWSDLFHASSRIGAVLRPGVGSLDLLRALAPGGSVTGAPKRAACALLAGLEPVGRGPAMGAFGFLRPGGLDLGLTIRTVALADGRVHLWAGGGITWGSAPDAEVAEAHAKARPVVAALGACG